MDGSDIAALSAAEIRFEGLAVEIMRGRVAEAEKYVENGQWKECLKILQWYRGATRYTAATDRDPSTADGLVSDRSSVPSRQMSDEMTEKNYY